MSKKRRRRKRKQRERAKRRAEARLRSRDRSKAGNPDSRSRRPSRDEERDGRRESRRDERKDRKRDKKRVKKYKSLVDKLKQEKADSATQYSDLVGQFNSIKEDYEGAQDELTSTKGRYKEELSGLRDKIGGYEEQIGGFRDQISDYRSRFSDLTNQYSTALANNATLVAERDAAQKRFQEQSAQYEQAKTERDAYREAQVGEQLAGLRGGASAGGANQTSYASGALSSGRSGYSSSTQDRDKGLADYVMQEGGVTDSVLNREGPVVQLMGRRERRPARKQASQGAKSMTSGAGTGSYYASRFGG